MSATLTDTDAGVMELIELENSLDGAPVCSSTSVHLCTKTARWSAFAPCEPLQGLWCDARYELYEVYGAVSECLYCLGYVRDHWVVTAL